VENIPNELSTPERLLEIIHTAHFDDVGICFDFGHAHMMNAVAESFSSVRKLVCSTHVHDNAGVQDSHLWPGAGTIAWKEAMELLRTAPQTPALMLEVAEDENVNPLEKVRATFEMLEAM
jgi:sugar phosphate isomerase/epimerase